MMASTEATHLMIVFTIEHALAEIGRSAPPFNATVVASLQAARTDALALVNAELARQCQAPIVAANCNARRATR